MRRTVCGTLLVALLVAACSGSNSKPSPVPRSSQSQKLLDPTSGGKLSSSEWAFAPILQSGQEAVCGFFIAPRLVTLGGNAAGNSIFKVDVVVGSDGEVESVLILDSAQDVTEGKIADRVSRWIYKPALCDGIPVAAEGRIEIRGE